MASTAKICIKDPPPLRVPSSSSSGASGAASASEVSSASILETSSSSPELLKFVEFVELPKFARSHDYLQRFWHRPSAIMKKIMKGVFVLLLNLWTEFLEFCSS